MWTLLTDAVTFNPRYLLAGFLTELRAEWREHRSIRAYRRRGSTTSGLIYATFFEDALEDVDSEEWLERRMGVTQPVTAEVAARAHPEILTMAKDRRLSAVPLSVPHSSVADGMFAGTAARHHPFKGT